MGKSREGTIGRKRARQTVSLIDAARGYSYRAAGNAHAPLNRLITGKLREAADLPDQQQANPLRVGARLPSTETVAGLDRDLSEIVKREGPGHLVELPRMG